MSDLSPERKFPVSFYAEETLRLAGLDPVQHPAPMKYPRVVDENTDQLWLRCQVDGVEREVDLSIGQAQAMVITLLGWIFKASKR